MQYIDLNGGGNESIFKHLKKKVNLTIILLKETHNHYFIKN